MASLGPTHFLDGILYFLQSYAVDLTIHFDGRNFMTRGGEPLDMFRGGV